MLSKQRLFFFTLLLSGIFMLSSCGDKAVAEVDGYEKYTNERLSLELQYPEDWLMVDETYYTDSFRKASILDRAEPYGLSSENLEDVLSNCDFVLYNLTNAGEQVIPNMSLLVQNQPGLKQDNFRDEEFQQDFYDQLISELSIVSTPRSTVAPEGKTLGNNYFFLIQYEYTMFGQDIATYQACTADKNNNLFIFTFAAAPDQFEDYLETFDSVLSTVNWQ